MDALQQLARIVCPADIDTWEADRHDRFGAGFADENAECGPSAIGPKDDCNEATQDSDAEAGEASVPRGEHRICAPELEKGAEKDWKGFDALTGGGELFREASV